MFYWIVMLTVWLDHLDFTLNSKSNSTAMCSASTTSLGNSLSNKPLCSVKYLSDTRPGSSMHDARVLQNSAIYTIAENETFLPTDRHLVGDSAYRSWFNWGWSTNGIKKLATSLKNDQKIWGLERNRPSRELDRSCRSISRSHVCWNYIYIS